MKAFTNASPKELHEAVTLARNARLRGQLPVFAGGGSDVLGMMKEHLATPDVLVYLKSIKGLDTITSERTEVSGSTGGTGITVGGLITLDTLSRHTTVRRDYRVLAEAAETVATPQIRNVATLAGNVCQRPWCWYFRNGFNCLKAGGSICYSINGENQFHAIFGGGPSYIVHPSDTAPALVALNATFRIVGPAGERAVAASEFFTLPTANPARENILREDEVLAAVLLPRTTVGTRSTYLKVMDREAWTHALVSAAIVLHMDEEVCRSARLVLGGVAPIPWRLPDVEKMIAGQRITPALAAKAGDAAVEGARPLAKNGYKVAMTRALVRRTIESLGRSA